MWGKGWPSRTYNKINWREGLSLNQSKRDHPGNVAGLGYKEANCHSAVVVEVERESRETAIMTATLSMSFTKDVCSSGEVASGLVGAYN